MGLSIKELTPALRETVSRLGPDATVDACLDDLRGRGLDVSRPTVQRALKGLREAMRREFALRELPDATQRVSEALERVAPVLTPEEQREVRNDLREGVADMMAIIRLSRPDLRVERAQDLLPVAQATQALVQSILAIDAAEHAMRQPEPTNGQGGSVIDITPIPRTASGLTPLQDALRKMREERERKEGAAT